jgi:plasmid replication initiation protein
LTNKTPIYELDDFRNKLGLGVTEYKTMSNFNTNVLNIAIQQINKFTDIKVKVNRHKKGVKISGFSFEITQRKTKQQSNLSQDNTDKFYKLTDSQINMFGNQLSRLPELSNLAVEGESYEALAAKIKEMLREPEQQRQFLPNLRNLGFKP